MNGDERCDPMGDGCKALTRVKGDLQNEKASKNFVDTQIGEIHKKIDKVSARLWWLITILIANLVGMIISITGGVVLYKVLQNL